MSKFSERLKELRVDRKLTQKKLAYILQTNNSSICDWECGRAEPSIDMIIKLCTYLETSSDYLLGIEEY